TQQEGVDGIVITFVDISELRSTQGDLQEFNQQLEMRIVERTEQVHALSAALTVAEQWERRRISAILHDNLQQVLYGLQMRTSLLKDDMTALAHADLATQLAEANELLDQAIAATRSLSVELNPPILAGEGLEQGLHWLAHHMQENYGLAVEVSGGPLVRQPGESMRLMLVQLVRELLFNVVKHADVTQATVRIAEAGEQLMITVEDEGSGFMADHMQVHEHNDNHFGLFSVHERLALFGGELQIESVLGEGSRLTIIAPV
ncbi:MAG: histidine kinase, partial [Chloroflexota bacterium]|nr:histidine kinase [Chloroflexota bacterium]